MTTTTDFTPRWNFWRCTTCTAYYVTVEIDPGVTPFMLSCRNEGCGGQMHSAFYPKPENWPRSAPKEAQGVWYRPNQWERRVMKKKYPAMYAHVIKGGLIQKPPGPGTPAFPSVTGGGYGSTENAEDV